MMVGGAFTDETCELLTEILSILYKTVTKGVETHEDVITEDVLGDLQLLLVVKHTVLLRCVFECILTLFEWTEQECNL